jgi:hypothetical protein
VCEFQVNIIIISIESELGIKISSKKNSCIIEYRNLNTKDEKKYTDKKLLKLQTEHMNVLLYVIWFWYKDAKKITSLVIEL